MPNIRLMPPSAHATTTTVVNGRSYTCAPGATIDAPDFDAQVLGANGWVAVATVGATSARPASPRLGQQFHDTTLGYTIVFEGAAWRNPATGAAV